MLELCLCTLILCETFSMFILFNSLSLSIKMNVLLFFPALGIYLVLQHKSALRTPGCLLVCVLVQVSAGVDTP